jgi:hypothetical protein
MGANDYAMDLVGNEFDKAHYVESRKEAHDSRGDLSIGRKPILNQMKDIRYI